MLGDPGRSSGPRLAGNPGPVPRSPMASHRRYAQSTDPRLLLRKPRRRLADGGQRSPAAGAHSGGHPRSVDPFSLPRSTRVNLLTAEHAAECLASPFVVRRLLRRGLDAAPGGTRQWPAEGVNRMTRQPVADRLKHSVAGMVALEARTEALLGRLRGEVEGHLGAASALERYHATSEAQRDRLKAHLWALGGEAGDAPAGAPPSDGAPATAGATGPGGTASRALRDAYLALNEAAFGYGVLHETAHVVDSVRHAATIQLAERHLRAYTAGAQELNQLLADVVACELRQEGQYCECRCPSCDLGICWCVAHTTDAINTAWRDTAPAYPSAGLRVAPSPRRPPDLDVREGDLVIAVDGQRVASTADVTSV